MVPLPAVLDQCGGNALQGVQDGTPHIKYTVVRIAEAHEHENPLWESTLLSPDEPITVEAHWLEGAVQGLLAVGYLVGGRLDLCDAVSVERHIGCRCDFGSGTLCTSRRNIGPDGPLGGGALDEYEWMRKVFGYVYHCTGHM